MCFFEKKGTGLMICMHSLHTKWHIFHAEEIYEAMRIFGKKYLLLWFFYFDWKWAAPRVLQMFTVRQNTFFTRTDHLPSLFHTRDWALVLCFSCHKTSTRPSHLCQHRPYFRVLGDTITCLELTRSSQCVLHTAKWARCTKTCIT